ncbi:MAG TPA: DUF86 domain-containing protein [Bacteriovoracaceae bacterium]|nr:DUF86 domain-containing protein [Bacteriovoracaceae bacterium]
MSEIDIVLSKINVIKNCLMAIEKATFTVKDPDFQLSIYELNLQRAIQACIDLANVTIAKEGLGLPNTYKQSFEILNKHTVLSNEVSQKLCSMVGFRNISVHDYEEIKPAIVHSIVKNHLNDFEEFYTVILKRAQNWK